MTEIDGVESNVGFFTDITNFRKKDEEIRKLSRVVNQSPAIVVITDLDGNIEYTNHSFKELTGYSEDEIIGQNPRLLKSGKHEKEFYEELWLSLSTGKEWRGEFQNKKKNSDLYWESAYIFPIFNDNSKTTNYIKISTDITERKQAEEALRASKERIQMLNKIIRHDLANDLTVIKSAINIFKRTSDLEMISEIEKRINKSRKTIDSSKEYEDFINSNTKLREIEIYDLVSAIVSEYPQIAIQLEGKCKCFADETIYSVFHNLISNAINHGNSTKLKINVQSDKENCLIRIADNGKGIPDKIKGRIFEEGFCYGKTGHTGIGLHIVKNTIERFGGSISVEDNEPNGAVFSFTLRKVL